MKKSLQVVVGAQFGSEAKGHVTQRLTERAQDGGMPQVIRVAGPNAGHTGYDATGRAWALRQVPVAAVTEGPVVLGVGAGSEIDLPVLLDEIDLLKHAGLLANKLLYVHEEATMITDNHKYQESPEAADLIGKIGSTGKGIGAARAGRIMRRADRLKDDEPAMEALTERGVAIATSDSTPEISVACDTVIIEGTQGYGLGLRAGYYPQCTSSDCRAQDFIAMAGVSPWMYEEVEVWAVARMFPIRVAGNSGPLRNETTWEELGLPEERTTVTKKVRRVGHPDWDLVGRAVRANGGSPTVRLAITMVDQMFPGVANQTIGQMNAIDWRDVKNYVASIRQQTGAEVGCITTGPNTASFIGDKGVLL